MTFKFYHYLYYKLYQAALKSPLKDISHISASAWLGCLIGINLIVINGILAKTIALPFLFSNPTQGGLIVAVLIVLVILYFRKSKRNAIFGKYSRESNYERKKGNTIVAIYIALSFLLIFAVAFYKPGKL